MGKDEPVDGPRIAAEILKKMPLKDQDRLVKAIQQAAPDAAQKIQENLFSFEDIADLTVQGLQVLVREIDHQDLVRALKKASPKLKTAFFNNMTDRKRQLVQEDFEALPQLKASDVDEAQKRIIAKVDELRALGTIRTDSSKDVWV
jgi:flagellar motor switch protein FliG